MSTPTSSPSPLNPLPTDGGGDAPATPLPQRELKIVAHSMLFYWWPVWLLGGIFALWTYIEGYRMVVVPSGSVIEMEANDPTKGKITLAENKNVENSRLLKDADQDAAIKTQYRPRVRVANHAWMGPLFLITLLLVIIITNIPLRGLWSVVVIIGIVMLALILSLLELWDNVLRAFGDLHVYINMSGYMLIGIFMFAAWGISVWVFDKRTYIIFTPGQVQVCEEIGGREKTFDTTGMTVEKQRDDWFRHTILGFGTGDLIVRTAGADRQEIIMPNVAFIGFKLQAVQQLLRSRQVKANP